MVTVLCIMLTENDTFKEFQNSMNIKKHYSILKKISGVILENQQI